MAEPIDFETFAARNGASRQGYGDAGMHSPAAHVGKANWRAKLKVVRLEGDALQARRDKLRAEYDSLCLQGVLRPLSYRERLTLTAQGNPDRDDVQAARRLCVKKGWDW